MVSNLDIAIFIGFMAVTIIIGLSSSYGVKNIKEYAIGDKKFSTATIAATIVATWAGGKDFAMVISETYKNGLYFMWSEMGGVLALFFMGLFLIPRMEEFLNNLSTPEAMGSIYGSKVRIVSAVSGILISAGILAGQLKVSGLIFEYCFQCPERYGILIGGALVTFYSALGGLRSVTFTDVVQLVTFGTMLPTLAFCIFDKISNVHVVVESLSQHKLFDYTEVFDFTRPKSLYYLFFFIWAIVPGFSPASFQRIAMAKNVMQSRSSFIVAGFIWLFVVLTLMLISVLVFATHSNLDTNNVVKYILLEQSYSGLRGFILAGIMAMILSTADSYINAASVIFIHDFCKPLGIAIRKELAVTRIAAIAVATIAITIAMSGESLFKLGLLTSIFSMPVVTVPFIMTILGFRSSGKSVLIAMTAGASTAALWKMFSWIDIPAAVPGMIANLIFLFAAHYLLRQKGGWVGIKDNTTLAVLRQNRRFKIRRFLDRLKNFNFTKFMEKNSPNGEVMYVYTGLFCFFSLYSNMATVSYATKLLFPSFFEMVTPSVLLSATALLSYPLWLQSWKDNDIMVHLIWNLVAFYGLILIGFLFAILSNFATFQTMILIINLLIIAVLVRWQWALAMMIIGSCVSIKTANIYFPGVLSTSTISLKLQVIYLLLLVGSLLIIFLKPKQENEILLTERVENLRSRILLQERDFVKALSLKSEFVRDMQNQYNTPTTGIMSMSQMLFDSYDDLTDNERKEATEIIIKGFLRLEAFDANIAALSKLSRYDHQLKFEKVNFSELLKKRLEVCKKLYEEDDSRQEFTLNITNDIYARGDKHYLLQMIDNLLINAITYCKNGAIRIGLEKVGTYALSFSVRDEGIGIPDSELLAMFSECVVSAKGAFTSGGRIIGLALAKKVAEVHDGNIIVNSDGKSWTVFKVTLPLR